MLSKIICFISIFVCCNTVTAQTGKSETVGKESTFEYTINDKVVTEKEFSKFLSSLNQMDHTWFCAETNTGGETGYSAKDWKGVVYEYLSISDGGKSIHSIKKKANSK